MNILLVAVFSLRIAVAWSSTTSSTQMKLNDSFAFSVNQSRLQTTSTKLPDNSAMKPRHYFSASDNVNDNSDSSGTENVFEAPNGQSTSFNTEETIETSEITPSNGIPTKSAVQTQFNMISDFTGITLLPSEEFSSTKTNSKLDSKGTSKPKLITSPPISKGIRPSSYFILTLGTLYPIVKFLI